MTFSRRHPLFVCRRTSRRQLGKLVGFLSVKDVDLIQSNLKLFQFLVIIDYFLGKIHIDSSMLCYSLAKHARFSGPAVVTFSRRHI